MEEEFEETYESCEPDYSDYVYDSYIDDLLTEDYDTLVEHYGKYLADNKWRYCDKEEENER